jgi:hypothetical protein
VLPSCQLNEKLRMGSTDKTSTWTHFKASWTKTVWNVRARERPDKKTITAPEL